MKIVKIINGIPHIRVVYTDSCSGCLETIDGHIPYQNGKPIYPYDAKAGCNVGSGCGECGYTGKRQHDFWMPDYEKVCFETGLLKTPQSSSEGRG